MLKKHQQDMKLKCERWLNPPNIREIHQRHTQAKLRGTCDWIWLNPSFLEWNNPSSSPTSDRLLYIYGTHGCGKTVLASSIVDGLKHQQQQTLFFSFSGTDASRQN